MTRTDMVWMGAFRDTYQRLRQAPADPKTARDSLLQAVRTAYDKLPPEVQSRAWMITSVEHAS